MNYKDNIAGLEAGFRSGKVPDWVVTQEESVAIANKAKRDREELKTNAIKKSTFEALKEQVARGKITSRQAEMIHHGAPLHIVFKKQ